MKKLLILFAVLSGILFSCHKKEKPAPDKPQPEDTRQYSYWTVNEDSFKTNDVDEVLGLGMCVLGNAQKNHTNNFSLYFNIGRSLPVYGSFKIDCSTQNSTFVCMDFVYNGIGYLININGSFYLTAGENNSKAQYKLAPTWFYNEQDPNDSVLIQGVFNEP